MQLSPPQDLRPDAGIVRPDEVDRVYHQLLAWLVDAVLPPGAFLSEPDLAQRCSTSRTPVREACMRLHQDRWLTRFPRKGFLVTPVTVQEIADLYEYRTLLEGYAAERVAGSAQAGQIRELRGLIDLEDAPGTGLAELVRANEAFHLGLAALAGNRRVVDQLHLVLAFCRRLDTLYLRLDQTWIPHRDLLAALERGDGPGSRQAMAAHLDHSRTDLVRMFGSAAARLP
jgi:DNA-binding GntR family transcriptional regulator